MNREKGSSAPEQGTHVSPEKREPSFLDEEERLGDRIADIAGEVERSGPSELTFDALEALAGDAMPVPEEMKEEASAIDAAINRVKNKMKGMLESGRDALRGRKTFEYEYRDGGGELLCKVKAEMGTSKKRVLLDTVDGREGRVRTLHSLVLEGEKDGHTVTVDVLRLANKHRVAVLVGTERLENSAYDFDQQEVIVSSLENPFDLATLLHEFGHADQSKERRFVASGIVDIRQPEASKPNSADLPAAEIEELLKKVADAIPEVEQVIDRQALARIKALEIEMSGITLDSNENAKKVDELYDRKKAVIQEELRLDDLVLLPRRMLERDATRRAFLWLRELREQGIDLLGKLPEPPREAAAKGRKDEGSGCEQVMKQRLAEGVTESGETAETTIREELNRSLGTYKAERTRFKKPGSGGPGIRPRAGGNRKI